VLLAAPSSESFEFARELGVIPSSGVVVADRARFAAALRHCKKGPTSSLLFFLSSSAPSAPLR